jgi:hypothetical protein
VEITSKVEKRLRENSSAGSRREFYEAYKHKIKFPEYFPPMRFMVAADEKLYIMTYKTTDDKTQFIIHTTPGKFLEKVFLPVKDMEVRHFCPFTIKNNKLYHLYDNEETEIWELHMTTIQRIRTSSHDAELHPETFKLNKSFCGCFTDRGGFFKKSPWPPEAKKTRK